MRQDHLAFFSISHINMCAFEGGQSNITLLLPALISAFVLQ